MLAINEGFLRWWGDGSTVSVVGANQQKGRLRKPPPAVQPWSLGDIRAVSQNCAGTQFYSFSILTMSLLRVNAWFLCIRDGSWLAESFWWRFCYVVTVLQSFETIYGPFYVNSFIRDCIQVYVSATWIVILKWKHKLWSYLCNTVCFFGIAVDQLATRGWDAINRPNALT